MRKAKKKCLSFLMFVFIFSQSFGQSFFLGATPVVLAEGTGRENDPIIIRTVSELQDISKGLNKHYMLEADIVIDEKNNWKPIGTSSAPFTGSLDGNGYKIINLTVESSDDYIGLFGFMAAAKIKNLILEDVKMKGRNNVGGIAGYSYGTSLIENCIVSGKLEGNGNIGGLVGVFTTGNGQIKKSAFNGEIRGSAQAGGLVGYLNNGQILQCSNKADITGTLNNIGGLVGRQSNVSMISESYNLGNVEGASYVGGIVGYHTENSKIMDTYNRGYVAGSGSFIGGITGYSLGSSENKVIINRCYSTGNVRGGSYIGGITGSVSYGTVTNCAAMGNYINALDILGCRVTGQIANSTVSNNVANEDMTVTIRFINKDIKSTNPLHTSEHGGNIAKSRLTENNLYLISVSWNFEYIWIMPEDGNDYPILRNAKKYETVPPQEVKVTGIQLSNNQKTLKISDSYMLDATVYPHNATNKNIIWTSSQPDIASVSDDGVVTAETIGDAVITAKTEDGGYEAACEVTVEEIGPETPKKLVNLALNKLVISDSVSGSNVPNNAVDGSYGTRWTAKTETSDVSLTVEFGKEVTFEEIKIVEHLNRINNFKLQYLNCNGWVDFYTGTTIGDSFHISFEPITTKQVRLLAISTTDKNGASIFEFEVYGEGEDEGEGVEPKQPEPGELVNIAENKNATSDSVSGSNSANNAVDGDYGTRWTAKSNTTNVHLAIDFEKEVTFEEIKIVEHQDRITNFKLQYLSDSEWVDFHTGTTIGDNYHISFDPITTTQVRLLAISTKGTNGASIFEFEVYGEETL